MSYGDRAWQEACLRAVRDELPPIARGLALRNGPEVWRGPAAARLGAVIEDVQRLLAAASQQAADGLVALAASEDPGR